MCIELQAASVIKPLKLLCDLLLDVFHFVRVNTQYIQAVKDSTRAQLCARNTII